MKIYRTSEIAEIVGIHSNTVRLYEKLNLISRPERLQNGHRIFTEIHSEVFGLPTTALRNCPEKGVAGF